MDFFHRVNRIVRANVERAEEPEITIEKIVGEIEQNLLLMRQGLAGAIASFKRTERHIAQNQVTAKLWYDRAQVALVNGKEELARNYLQQRQFYQQNLQSLQQQQEEQKLIIARLKQEMLVLEQKIAETKIKKDMYLSRLISAQASQKIYDLRGDINYSSANNVFEKMEDKILFLEAQAELSKELEQ